MSYTTISQKESSFEFLELFFFWNFSPFAPHNFQFIPSFPLRRRPIRLSIDDYVDEKLIKILKLALNRRHKSADAEKKREKSFTFFGIFISKLKFLLGNLEKFKGFIFSFWAQKRKQTSCYIHIERSKSTFKLI